MTEEKQEVKQTRTDLAAKHVHMSQLVKDYVLGTRELDILLRAVGKLNDELTSLRSELVRFLFVFVFVVQKGGVMYCAWVHCDGKGRGE